MFRKDRQKFHRKILLSLTFGTSWSNSFSGSSHGWSCQIFILVSRKAASVSNTAGMPIDLEIRMLQMSFQSSMSNYCGAFNFLIAFYCHTTRRYCCTCSLISACESIGFKAKQQQKRGWPTTNTDFGCSSLQDV